ncbi:MAG: EscN/YscN/HrcN family type III secretion system ATPase [Candidatus Eremiobacteraeota bacterium]|nr:EscN/YscN/HrcN family type III secretion system ATPase [Candidatus Eremiobacteraeota bacterium]
MVELPLHHGLCDGFVRRGRVTGVQSGRVVVCMPFVQHGAIVEITRHDGSVAHAEAAELFESGAICTPLDSIDGIALGAPASTTQAAIGAYAGPELLGQVVDAWGRPENGRRPQAGPRTAAVPLAQRAPVTRPLHTGVAAIDAFCTLGKGQRVGLFAGAGVGKSTLLRQIADGVECQAHVLALIGERAREANETIDAMRASDRWRQTTIVCATAGAPAADRLAAMQSALAQADWLCAQGADVLFTLDSLTRVAQAWREVALGAGQPAAQRGHPASMPQLLASILERAGQRTCGSITAVCAVLVDGDDPFEPVSDAARALLDGHIMLSRTLADAARYPAIDILRSSSRLMRALTSRQQRQDAALLRRALYSLEESADLVQIGAYQRGADAWLDAALDVRAELEAWLFSDDGTRPDGREILARIAARLRSLAGQETPLA